MNELLPQDEWKEILGLSFNDLLHMEFGVFDYLRQNIEEYKKMKDKAIQEEKKRREKEGNKYG